jgi:UDP-glucuronate 4-epimerase
MRLMSEGCNTIIGIDDINDYYDQALKFDRLRETGIYVEQDPPSDNVSNIEFSRFNIADGALMSDFFRRSRPDIVVHLAAQAGVRYSIDHPDAYIQSNVVGFANILEQCRRVEVKHLVYASSSSIYGLNKSMPYKVTDSANHPVSLYAASKKSDELMAHAYSHLYGLPTTGLRFFTVYGPWGRPDMAPFKFAKRIYAGEPIDVYNYGCMSRDFTYIDDIIEGIIRLLDKPPRENPDWDRENPDPATSSAQYCIHNIGRGEPVDLMTFIHAMELAIGKKAELNMLPMQPGDVKETYADTSSLINATGYRPQVSIEEGVKRFIEWYREYYHHE